MYMFQFFISKSSLIKLAIGYAVLLVFIIVFEKIGFPTIYESRHSIFNIFRWYFLIPFIVVLLFWGYVVWLEYENKEKGAYIRLKNANYEKEINSLKVDYDSKVNALERQFNGKMFDLEKEVEKSSQSELKYKSLVKSKDGLITSLNEDLIELKNGIQERNKTIHQMKEEHVVLARQIAQLQIKKNSSEDMFDSKDKNGLRFEREDNTENTAE